eukprot:4574698-Prymnesium_polylepis.1
MAAALVPEPLCDHCPSRCAGCPWAWMDDDFLASGGDESALRQRDAIAREALGLALLDVVEEGPLTAGAAVGGVAAD